MKMQILIIDVKCQINKSKLQFEEGVGPYKLATLAKRQGAEVRVFQDHLYDADPEKIAKIIRTFENKRTILAFSLLTNGLPTMLEIIRLTADLKLPVMIGGAGATIDPKTVIAQAAELLPIATPLILTEGDGENAFAQLLKIKPKNWQNYAEIWRRNDYGIIKEGHFQLCKIDDSPEADLSASQQRRLFLHLSAETNEPWQDRYNYLRSLTNSQVECGRGCYYRCGYCNTSCLRHQEVRKKPAGQVAREIINLHRRYGITFFSLTDNVALDRPYYWREFAKRLAEFPEMPQLFFGGYSAPHFLSSKEWHSELLPLLCEVGLRSIIVGVQSGSRRILKEIIHRPINDPEEALELVKRGVELGINIKTDFIIGHPTETTADLQDTYEQMKKIVTAGGETFVRKLNVIPHSRYDQRLKSGEWSLPPDSPERLLLENKIFALKRDDSHYRLLVLAGNRPMPNKYLIDRRLKIIYPHKIFSVEQLKEARQKLIAANMIESAKRRYLMMFDLLIDNRP